jgi:glycosyltransferase involved in cell wall biosynthesis
MFKKEKVPKNMKKKPIIDSPSVSLIIPSYNNLKHLKNNINKITFCIPSKNNLRYLKSSIRSIKQNSTLDNEIVVWVDLDEDGTEDWLKANNIKYLTNPEKEPQGIASGYNKCIMAASNKIVCMFHADMFMGVGLVLICLSFFWLFVGLLGLRVF